MWLGLKLHWNTIKKGFHIWVRLPLPWYLYVFLRVNESKLAPILLPRKENKKSFNMIEWNSSVEGDREEISYSMFHNNLNSIFVCTIPKIFHPHRPFFHWQSKHIEKTERREMKKITAKWKMASSISLSLIPNQQQQKKVYLSTHHSTTIQPPTPTRWNKTMTTRTKI